MFQLEALRQTLALSRGGLAINVPHEMGWYTSGIGIDVNASFYILERENQIYEGFFLLYLLVYAI